MKGYECARENEICKCGGNVNFGIDGGNEEFFGKWSDMTYVTDQINCTKENFPKESQKNVHQISQKAFRYFIKDCRQAKQFKALIGQLLCKIFK